MEIGNSTALQPFSGHNTLECNNDFVVHSGWGGGVSLLYSPGAVRD